MFYERTITETIRNVSETFPVLLLTGPRQVGKSTILERLMEPERKKVSLDNPTVRLLAKTDPEMFLQRYAPPVLIDEVQYAPELFPYIKILVDERKNPGDFWLTGSQMCIRDSMMGMLPSPHSGMVCGFCKDTIFFFHIYKCHISFIGFGFFIHKCKDVYKRQPLFC